MNKRPLYVSVPVDHDAFDVAPTQERVSVPPNTALRILRGEPSQSFPRPLPLVRRMPSANSTEEIRVEDVIGVEIASPRISMMPEPRNHLVSINATQELSAEDVLEARNAPIVDDDVDAFVEQGDRLTQFPCVVDTSELRVDRDRLTVLSTQEISVRKRTGGLFVGLVVGAALAVGIAAISQLIPTQSEGQSAMSSALHRSHSFGRSFVHRNALATVRAPAISGQAPFEISVDALPKSKRR